MFALGCLSLDSPVVCLLDVYQQIVAFDAKRKDVDALVFGICRLTGLYIEGP
jgi:hypothetical protein